MLSIVLGFILGYLFSNYNIKHFIIDLLDFSLISDS